MAEVIAAQKHFTHKNVFSFHLFTQGRNIFVQVNVNKINAQANELLQCTAGLNMYILKLVQIPNCHA